MLYLSTPYIIGVSFEGILDLSNKRQKSEADLVILKEGRCFFLSMIINQYFKITFLIRFLPSFIRKHIEQRESVRKITANMSWLFFDKFLRMGVGLIVGAWVARYLGPQEYGMINYASAYVALFGSFASLGLDNIVIRDLLNNPEKRNMILGSTFSLKLLGAALAAFLSIVSILFVRNGNSAIFILVILSATGLLFQAFNTIDLYFQSQVLSKYTVIAQNCAFLISSAAKVILILNKASFYAFAVVMLFEIILGSFFLLLLYHRRNKQSVFNWKTVYLHSVNMLKESWPLIIASMTSMLNMRIDQIFIGKMLDDSSVGNYSVAVRISEIWFMLPMVLGASIYPKIIEMKQKSHQLYIQKLNKICFLMCCFTLPFASVISFNADTIMELIFGSKYSEAGTILAIHIWSGVPFLTTFAYGQMFYIEKLTKLTFYTSIFAPICNITLNTIFIPKYGVIGAAATTLVTAFGVGAISLTMLYFHVKMKYNKVNS